MDLRGRTLDPDAWAAIRAAATAPDGSVRLGRCWFDDTVVEGVSFHGVVFEGDVSFGRTGFGKGVSFYRTVFAGNVSFHEAVFAGNASFHEAAFRGHADFSRACFSGDALFDGAVWHRDASFTEALFQNVADFDRAVFHRDALFQEACFRSIVSLRNTRVARHLLFDRARFQGNAWIGPLSAGGRIGLDAAYALRCLKVSARAPSPVTARRTVLDQLHLKVPADLSQAVVRSLLLEGVGTEDCVLDEAQVGALKVRGGQAAAEEGYRRSPRAVFALGTLALLAVTLAAFLFLHGMGQAPMHLAHLRP